VLEKINRVNNVVLSRGWSPTVRAQTGVLTQARSVGCVSFRFNDQRHHVHAFVPSLRRRTCVTYMLCNQEFHWSFYCGLWFSKGNPLEPDDVRSQRKIFATSELHTSRHSRKPTIQSTCDKETNRKFCQKLRRILGHFPITYWKMDKEIPKWAANKLCETATSSGS
jgi:hypothetical protein